MKLRKQKKVGRPTEEKSKVFQKRIKISKYDLFCQYVKQFNFKTK